MRRSVAAVCFGLALVSACADAPTRRDSTGSQATPESPASGNREADARAGADPTGGDVAGDRDVVVFLGTSLTAGYGLDPELAFPARIQAEIDREGLPFRVVNAGVSGETSAGGLRRLDWALRDRVAVLVIELGANDGLRGLDLRQLQDNLASIIVKTRKAWPAADIVLAGMEAPPNLGREYTDGFRDAFQTIARTHQVSLIPFLLEDVAGDPSLNLDDRIHPTAAGHEIIAETVWRTLGPLLRARPAPR